MSSDVRSVPGQKAKKEKVP